MKKLLFTLAAVCGITLTAQVPDKLLLKIFDAAYRSNPQQNIMLSPWGIQECYGMVAAGAGKVSGQELVNVLGLDPQTALETAKARTSLQKSQVQFNSFNAVLFDRKYTLKQEFSKKAANLYGSKIYSIDLARKAECADALNEIVKRESRNMFDKVFTPQNFEGNPVMVLLNVLYFKSRWMSPFKEYATAKERFMIPKNSGFEGIHHSEVDMMNDRKIVPYYNDGTIHAVTLDYSDERFKLMVLTTVNAAVPLEKVTQCLAKNGLMHFIRRSSDENKTDIKLPKFKLHSSVDLKKLLRGQGMPITFDPLQGDLTGMVENNSLYIAQSRQLVRLALDERGTEVAAVTYAVPKAACMPPQKEKINQFYADHPFVLVLFDSKTNAILLTAAVINPNAQK